MRAFSTLIAIIFLLMFSAIMIISMSGRLISRLQSSWYAGTSYQLDIIADTCREEVFRRLKNSLSYTGGQLTLPEGKCSVYIQGTDMTKTIVISVQNNLARKNIQTDVSITVSGEAINLSITKIQRF